MIYEIMVYDDLPIYCIHMYCAVYKGTEKIYLSQKLAKV
jgi:hypothetical protein